ncbi:MAG: CdvA-like protein [Candidatus Bathyarchaeia archaeon]
MLRKVLPSVSPYPPGWRTLTSWKASLDRINWELDSVKKGKQALDQLLSTGKISPTTYYSFNGELEDAVKEIEGRQRALMEDMAFRVGELEKQLESLELFFADLELRYIGGELSSELYHQWGGILALGLDATKKEMAYIKDPSLWSTPPPPTLKENVLEPRAEEAPQQIQEIVEIVAPVYSENEDTELIVNPLEGVGEEPEITFPINVEAPVKEVNIEFEEENMPNQKVKRVKAKPVTRKALTKKVRKFSPEKSAGKGNPSTGGFGMRCRNPWNGNCRNTDIELSIYYKGEFLPICHQCWKEIANKDLTW